jgi:hypothetical protein
MHRLWCPGIAAASRVETLPPSIATEQECRSFGVAAKGQLSELRQDRLRRNVTDALPLQSSFHEQQRWHYKYRLSILDIAPTSLSPVSSPTPFVRRRRTLVLPRWRFMGAAAQPDTYVIQLLLWVWIFSLAEAPRLMAHLKAGAYETRAKRRRGQPYSRNVLCRKSTYHSNQPSARVESRRLKCIPIPRISSTQGERHKYERCE